jgi:hypothetical protein
MARYGAAVIVVGFALALALGWMRAATGLSAS